VKITWTCYLHPYTAMGVIAINVVKELTKLGYDVGLNAINPPNDPNKVNPLDYSIEVQEALKKGHRFDSVNIFFAYPDVYPSHRCKINVGYTGADSTGWYTTQGQVPPWISCNEYMDFMLTPADYSRRIMKDCGVTKPIYLFPHGIDTSLFPYQPRVKNIPFTFVYCGEMSKRKGTQDLITTFKDLFGTSDKYRLLLRSNTDMLYYNGSEIEALTRNQPNIEVHFKNYGQQELSEYYKRGHVYVYPSRADWFGMTPFESLACGMPTIATETNGYYEFLQDYIVPVEYHDEEIGEHHPYLKGKWHVVDKLRLKEKMYGVFFDYDNLLNLARVASLHIHEKFTWERVTKDYLVPFLEEQVKPKLDSKVHQVKEALQFPVDPVAIDPKEIRMDNNDLRITVGIPTKDRGIELAILLQSLSVQTYQNFDVLINDDGLSGIIYNNTTIQGLINLLRQQGHDVTIMKGQTLGPHIAGQAILDNAKTELILRVDDDVALEPQCLENLIKPFIKDNARKVAAVGLILLNPHEDLNRQQMDLESFNRQHKQGLGKVFWINENQLFLSGMLSINRLPVEEEVEVEHLYSGFMYRKSVGKEIGGYPLNLSKVGHREETIFTYSMFKAGYKLYVHPKAISYHYHPMFGGIRETAGQMHKEELWKHDEEIFNEWIQKVLPNPFKKQTKPIIEEPPSDDQIDFTDIPELTDEQLKSMKPWKDVLTEIKNQENKPNVNFEGDSKKPIVSIIVLTHGLNHDGLKKVLSGIVNYTLTPYELIIVNNDNRPESLEDIRIFIDSEIKSRINGTRDVKIVQLEKEMAVGLARGIGVENSSGDSEYILFIDDDAQIVGFPDSNLGTDWVDMMLSIFNKYKDVAAVSPIHTWYSKLKCEAVSVACMLTSKKVWGVVGGFDPIFGNKEKGTWGYEDVDWSYRAQCKGFKLKWIESYYFPFIHEDTTFKPKSEERQQALLRAEEILLNKYDLNEVNYLRRFPYPLTDEQMEASLHGINLNIGCYYAIYDNFINIDLNPDVKPDLCINMMDIDKHFAKNSVSLIIASQVLEHVVYDEAFEFLRKCFEILKPGGHFVVEVPDCDNMDERIANGEMNEEDKRCHMEGNPQSPGQAHLHCYGEKNLQEMVTRAGFNILRRNPASSDKDTLAIRFDCIVNK